MPDLIIPPHAFVHGDGAPGSDHTGCYAWPAGQRLAACLNEVITLNGFNTCDIGCGRGLLGFTALNLGARVTFADGSPTVCAGVRMVLTTNHLSATVVEHQWGQPIPGAPFARILGGDILYRPEAFADLLASIAASLTADGVALLADPRATLEPELPALAAAAGLSWHPERRDRLTVVRVALRID